MTWIRHRQHRLARALLAAFALVWLQLAAVPCFAAHDVHPGHGAAHDTHCLYCPADAGSPPQAHCDDGGECAFPHDPQVDVRGAPSPLPPLAAGWSLAAPLAQTAVRVATTADRPESVPQRALSVRYCRFIE